MDKVPKAVSLLKAKGRETGFSAHKAVNTLKRNPLITIFQKLETWVQTVRSEVRQIVAINHMTNNGHETIVFHSGNSLTQLPFVAPLFPIPLHAGVKLFFTNRQQALEPCLKLSRRYLHFLVNGIGLHVFTHHHLLFPSVRSKSVSDRQPALGQLESVPRLSSGAC